MTPAEAFMWVTLLAYIAAVIVAVAVGVLVSLQLEARASSARLGARVYGSRSVHRGRVYGSRSERVALSGGDRR